MTSYIQRHTLTAYGHLRTKTGGPQQKPKGSSLIGTLYDSLQLKHKLSDTSEIPLVDEKLHSLWVLWRQRLEKR
jgi:hypothetical protein